ncbi:GSCOCG00011943001-RA-CDS, partial [Cotesia congregata]
PLSPLLFVVFFADLEEELEKGRWGGVELSGGKKVYSLAYADDIALMARDEEEMRGMIRTLERYVERKKLEVNVAKTKIMRCRKGGRRRKKIHWMMAKGARILGQVWSIGKRKFGDDWARRIWLFDRLVWSVMCYRVEIWGWKRRGEMESIQERYLRWV